MDTIASLLVLSTLLHIVTPEVFTQTSFRATVEITEGDSRIFSGENIRLKCSFSGDDSPSWNYLWFKGSEKLQHSRKVLILWNTKVQQSGKYYCQGVRESPIGKIRTLQSLPEEIYVDGGWAILSVPPKPGLVGNTLNLMCRVRENPPVHEIILYKDGVEVMRRNGPEPYFKLTNLTIKDHGMYSCRASFDTRRRTVSVTSTQSHVQILEVLTEPHLEIDVDFDPYQPSWMRLVCHLQYNAPAHAPQVDYYFYRNNNQVGPSSSESYRLVQKIPGHYQCKASVLDLGLVRWSKSRSFGKIKELQMMKMRPLPPPAPMKPLTSLTSSPDSPPASAVHRSFPQSSPAPIFIQHTEEKTSPSQPPVMPSQLAPSALQNKLQFNDLTPSPALPAESWENGGKTQGEE